MSNATHTPGPWEAVGNLVRSPMNIGGGVMLAECADRNYIKVNSDEAMANARLIAAAPELLSVLTFIQRGITGGHIKCSPYFDFDPDADQVEFKSVSQMIREVVAKATGRAS